jgi:hypothetical protein
LATSIVATMVLLAPAAADAAGNAGRAAAAPADPTAAAAARVATARQQADALASRYFAALNRGATLDVQIANLEARLRSDEARAAGLRARAGTRARQIYESGGSTVVDFFDGRDPLESARRDRLMAAANARDAAVFSDLARQNEALRARRKQLRDDRKQQHDVALKLHDAQGAMNAQLATAQKELSDARAAAAAALAAQQAAARQRAGGRPASSPASAPAITTPPLGRPPSGGGGSHHDDPFLVCTRDRESHGDYTVVNPAGPWYGAYQFAQSTWDSVANHAGRLDLVGVHPSAASPSDQDEIAWTLYQWQGKGPWGGLC